MADAMFFEARGEGLEGMVDVGRNILLRKELGWRGASTVCEVVHTPWQYSYLWDGSSLEVRRQELRVYYEAILLAEEILSAESLPPWTPECPRGATHYHTTDSSPSWSHPEKGSMRKVCGVRGNHIFYVGN